MTTQDFDSLLANLHDPDNEVRRSSAYHLGELGDKRAVEPLINALDDADRTVVSSAAWALGRLGDERAIEPLISHSEHRPVVHGLEKLGEKALLAVINVIPVSSGKKRHSALQSIRQFLSLNPSWARPIIEQEAFDGLLEVLEDTDEHIRGYAAVVLCDIGKAEAVEHIQELANDPSVYVRCCVASVLGTLGNATTIPVLEQMQRNDMGTVNVYNPEGGYFSEKISDVAARSIHTILKRRHD